MNWLWGIGGVALGVLGTLSFIVNWFTKDWWR